MNWRSNLLRAPDIEDIMEKHSIEYRYVLANGAINMALTNLSSQNKTAKLLVRIMKNKNFVQQHL